MRRAHRAGFTLVEMIVVIGIIVLLAGLTLSVGVAVSHQSEVRQTRAALLLLDAAVQEWQVQADRKLTWWQPGDPSAGHAAADVHGDTEQVLLITEVLQVITKPAAVRDIVARIDPGLLYTYRQGVYPPWIDTDPEKQQLDAQFDGAITVLDAWGQPIYATHPGRVWIAASDSPPGYPTAPDADATIRTYNEEIYGVAAGRRMCFVSSGPDGSFGDLHPYASPKEHLPVEDNVYSYPVQPPGSSPSGGAHAPPTPRPMVRAAGHSRDAGRLEKGRPAS